MSWVNFYLCLLLVSYLSKFKTGNDVFSLPVLASFFSKIYTNYLWCVPLLHMCRITAYNSVIFLFYLHIYKIFPKANNKDTENFWNLSNMLWLSTSEREDKVLCQNMVIQSIFDRLFTEILFKFWYQRMGFVCLNTSQ